MLANQNIIFIAMGGAIFIFLLWVIWLEVRLKRIFRGRRTKDLESLLSDTASDIEEIRKRLEKDNIDLRTLEKELEQSVRHIGIVRFNAFNEAGGDQSFAFALLNDKKDGVVISSIHNRDSNRVYAKPIIKTQSSHHLSEEEKEAITRALAREISSPK